MFWSKVVYFTKSFVINYERFRTEHILLLHWWLSIRSAREQSLTKHIHIPPSPTFSSSRSPFPSFRRVAAVRLRVAHTNAQTHTPSGLVTPPPRASANKHAQRPHYFLVALHPALLTNTHAQDSTHLTFRSHSALYPPQTHTHTAHTIFLGYFAIAC